MITRLVWTTWTPISAAPKRPLNLMTHYSRFSARYYSHNLKGHNTDSHGYRWGRRSSQMFRVFCDDQGCQTDDFSSLLSIKRFVVPWVENECCCLRIVNMSNVDFNLKKQPIIHINISITTTFTIQSIACSSCDNDDWYLYVAIHATTLCLLELIQVATWMSSRRRSSLLSGDRYRQVLLY